MQIKPKSERMQEIELDIVLVNQIFRNIRPVLHWIDRPSVSDPDIGAYTLESRHNCVEICSQNDVRLKEFPKVFADHFRITDGDRDGFSVPIGALRDTDDESACNFQVSDNMLRVAIPRDLYSIILAIRDLFEYAGLYVTDSDVVRYMFWTKYPKFITPNGFAMICNSTSWFCDSIGHLCLFETDFRVCNLQEFYSFNNDEFAQVFEFKDWDTSFDTTSVTIHVTNRISILSVELLKRVNADKRVNSKEETTILSKEDTNNESIK